MDDNSISQSDVETGVIPAKVTVAELVCNFSLMIKDEIASSLHSSQRQCYQANSAVVASSDPVASGRDVAISFFQSSARLTQAGMTRKKSVRINRQYDLLDDLLSKAILVWTSCISSD